MIEPYNESRPWGNFVRFTSNESSTVKIITVNAGQSVSLQIHQGRDEFWHILSGSGEITIGDEKKPAQKGNEFFIPRQTKHRVTAGESGIEFLEISFGMYNEEDITRLQDDYGRTS